MKKIITTFMMMAMMMVAIPMLAGSADAQTRYRTRRTYTQTYERPSFYSRHRNLINIGIGTAAGAGGSALYTYKLNPKTNRYYRVYR